MDAGAIRVFSSVMELGSFAAAARQLGVDPSSVSRSVSTLEAELGFRLFQRTTRKLAPTEAGRTYYLHVRDLIEQLDAAAEAARDLIQEPSGALRISASTHFGQTILASVLPDWIRRHPRITLELVLADHYVDLVSDRIDLAIRFGVEPTGDMIAERLFERRFVVCASPEYLASHGRPETPADLLEHSCLTFSAPGYRDRWRFRGEDGASFEVPVRGRVTASHGGAVVACAMAGLGPAMLADWAAATALAEGRLVDLFPDHDVTSTEFETSCWLVYPSRSYMPEKLKSITQFLKHELARAAQPSRPGVRRES